jgi:hypothetical protein
MFNLMIGHNCPECGYPCDGPVSPEREQATLVAYIGAAKAQAIMNDRLYRGAPGPVHCLDLLPKGT